MDAKRDVGAMIVHTGYDDVRGISVSSFQENAREGTGACCVIDMRSHSSHALVKGAAALVFRFPSPSAASFVTVRWVLSCSIPQSNLSSVLQFHCILDTSSTINQPPACSPGPRAVGKVGSSILIYTIYPVMQPNYVPSIKSSIVPAHPNPS